MTYVRDIETLALDRARSALFAHFNLESFEQVGPPRQESQVKIMDGGKDRHAQYATFQQSLLSSARKNLQS
jgi:hypothetical protein